MADTATLSVIFSGVIGIGGLVVAARGHSQIVKTELSKLEATAEEEQRKRLEARREDLRTVLDEAAKTAMSIRVAASAEELGSRRDAIEEIRNVALGAHEMLARIGVRVGPQDPLYERYECVTDALEHWREARARTRAASGGRSDGELQAAESNAAGECKKALECFLDEAKTQLDVWEREGTA